MDHRLPYPNRHLSVPLWVLSFATVVFASGAVFIVLWSPRALMLALGSGLLALLARFLFVQVRDAMPVAARSTAARASAARANEAASTVSGAGLVIAAVVIAPLLAFALLWTALLAILGGTWLLHLVGLA